MDWWVTILLIKTNSRLWQDWFFNDTTEGKMGTKIRTKEEIQQKQQIEYYGSNNDNDNDDNNKAGIIRLSLVW